MRNSTTRSVLTQLVCNQEIFDQIPLQTTCIQQLQRITTLMCGLTDINNLRFGNEKQYYDHHFSYLMQYGIQIFQHL